MLMKQTPFQVQYLQYDCPICVCVLTICFNNLTLLKRSRSPLPAKHIIQRYYQIRKAQVNLSF